MSINLVVAEWLFPSELLKAEIKKLKQKQSDEAKWHIDSQVLSKWVLKISTPGFVTYLRRVSASYGAAELSRRLSRHILDNTALKLGLGFTLGFKVKVKVKVSIGIRVS